MPESPAISADVAAPLLAILREAFEGPGDEPAAFSDRTPAAGLFHTLGPVTAREASRVAGGTSIAAHVRHILFGIRAATSSLEGDRTPRDWRENWHTDPVSRAEWDDLRDGLRSAYTGLREAVRDHAGEDGETLGEAAGAIAHIAYHLGAIRAKIACGMG